MAITMGSVSVDDDKWPHDNCMMYQCVSLSLIGLRLA